VAFGPVQPGEWDLVLWQARPPAVEGLWILGRIAVALAPGDQDVTLAMPPLHALRVAFADAEPGAHIGLAPAARRLGAGKLYLELGADRTVTFPFVPPGAYRVLLYDAMEAHHPHMSVTVPSKGVVPFVPDLYNALLVTVEDPAGYWSQCGLRTGELIVGFDGAKIEPTWEVEAIVPRLHVAADHKMVLRIREPSGRERDVEVLYHRFFAKKGSHGSLEPVFR
jgi:hypothetical protein